MFLGFLISLFVFPALERKEDCKDSSVETAVRSAIISFKERSGNPSYLVVSQFTYDMIKVHTISLQEEPDEWSYGFYPRKYFGLPLAVDIDRAKGFFISVE